MVFDLFGHGGLTFVCVWLASHARGMSGTQFFSLDLGAESEWLSKTL